MKNVFASKSVPPIHLYIRFILSWSQGWCTTGDRWHLEQVASSSQGNTRQLSTETLTCNVNLKLPLTLMLVCVNSGKKLGYPERTEELVGARQQCWRLQARLKYAAAHFEKLNTFGRKAYKTGQRLSFLPPDVCLEESSWLLAVWTGKHNGGSITDGTMQKEDYLWGLDSEIQ